MPNAPAPVARTPLHHWHATHGAHLAERDGWQVVTAYSAVEREVVAARAGLGLADVSAWAKVSLRGPGVPALVRSQIPGSAAQSPRGVAAIPEEAALACRLTEDHLLLLGSAAAFSFAHRLAGLLQNWAVVRTDVTSALAGFMVVGPSLEEFLRRLTQLDVRAAHLPVNACAETALAGVEALLVRTAETSLPSMRVYVGWDFGEYVWERMLEAGQEWSITPLGMEALGFLARPPAA
jgi:sarcosine oxidase subunit alpha